MVHKPQKLGTQIILLTKLFTPIPTVLGPGGGWSGMAWLPIRGWQQTIPHLMQVRHPVPQCRVCGGEELIQEGHQLEAVGTVFLGVDLPQKGPRRP
jgi:hypothetical protein